MGTTPAGGRVSLPSLLHDLVASGIDSVLVEGGPTVSTEFLGLRLVDRVVVYVAPRILGAGMDSIGDLGLRQMNMAIPLRDVMWVPVGLDIMLDGTPVWPEETR